jgi:hypothetical protein
MSAAAAKDKPVRLRRDVWFVVAIYFAFQFT